MREVVLKPQEVLELMHSAPERYDTVRAALRYRGDGPTIKVVREQFSRSEVHRRTFGDRLVPSEPIRHPEPDVLFGWRRRVWSIGDHRWRRELELPGGGVDITASTGRMHSRWTPEVWPAMSRQGFARGGPTVASAGHRPLLDLLSLGPARHHLARLGA
jgi:hypothetical protein